MNNLDYLIPKEIIDLCNFDLLDIKITLLASSANGNWPKVKVLVDDQTIYNDTVDGRVEIPVNMTTTNPNVKILLVYYGKTNKDTIVKHGEIIENQSVLIDNIVINGVNVVKTNIIYGLGNYIQDLDEAKLKYFIEHGYETGPSHSLHMFENGTWTLNLEMPVLSYFSRLKTPVQHHNWPNHKLLNDIYETILQLEK